MKYQAPYGSPGGPNDTTANYINGNPSTGTMGSIPPAAAVEYPQREIVNFETDSGLTTSDSDLHQLSKSVQNGRVNYCTDAGTPNFIAITPTPALAAYQPGQHFRIKVANPNTGPVQLNASGLGWAPVVHGDKSPMTGGELFALQIIDVAYDGSNWQMMTGGLSGTLIMMTAPRSFYVNTATGNDTTLDGSQATVDVTNTHGPFKTLRHALAMTSKYNLSGFQFNIYLADGIYTESTAIQCPVPNGAGSIYIHGNTANPSNVKLVNSGTGSTLVVSDGLYFLDGVSLQSTAGQPGDNGECLWVALAGRVWLNAVNFYGCADYHMLAGPGGGSISLGGPIGVYGSAVGGHMAAIGGSILIATPPPTLNIYNSVSFGQFCYANSSGTINPIYTAINVITGTVTGQKYIASANGVINTSGRGTSYLPGTVAGATSSGGQYV